MQNANVLNVRRIQHFAYTQIMVGISVRVQTFEYLLLYRTYTLRHNARFSRITVTTPNLYIYIYIFNLDVCYYMHTVYRNNNNKQLSYTYSLYKLSAAIRYKCSL